MSSQRNNRQKEKELLQNLQGLEKPDPNSPDLTSLLPYFPHPAFLQEAGGYYKSFVNANRNMAQVILNLSYCLALSGQAHRAMETLIDVIQYLKHARAEERPLLAQAYTYLAAAYQSLSYFDEAIELYERAIKINPENTTAIAYRQHLMNAGAPHQGIMRFAVTPDGIRHLHTWYYAPLEKPHIKREIMMRFELISFKKQSNTTRLNKAIFTAWISLLESIKHDPGTPNKHTYERIARELTHTGWTNVRLTERNHGADQDIIAELAGQGALRIAGLPLYFLPRKVISQADLSTLGLFRESNTVHGRQIFTSTTTFANVIYKENKQLIPERLELWDGPNLYRGLLAYSEAKKAEDIRNTEVFRSYENYSK